MRDRRARPEPDAHPVGDQLSRRPRGGLLLPFGGRGIAQRLPVPPSRTLGLHGAELIARDPAASRRRRRSGPVGPWIRNPCPMVQSSSRARASWRLVSIPTAIAVRPDSLASAIAAANIARRSLS